MGLLRLDGFIVRELSRIHDEAGIKLIVDAGIFDRDAIKRMKQVMKDVVRQERDMTKAINHLNKFVEHDAASKEALRILKREEFSLYQLKADINRIVKIMS